ncbi:MAG: membrane protein insertion efficiency factor YidD [Kiritimatiellae bacterium]|nr:membrane protein insertion efficiency factor YidD [Kiritimatiellia bacterium]
MKRIVISALKIYKCTLSIVWGPCCRFYPTCSAYCIEAIEEYGVRRGAWLGVKRLCKCHPFCRGGVDLVPEHSEVKEQKTEIRLASNICCPVLRVQGHE